MAKVPFSKLQAKMDGEVIKNSYHNLAGEEICYEVKHYLPFTEKLELVTNIVNKSIDDNGFYNPMRVKFNTVLEITYAYTNLSFTEKMKEDSFKLYDILVSTGIFTDIIGAIREEDWIEIQDNIWSTIENIYDYKNSAAGILEMISNDYSAVNFNLEEIQDKLGSPESLELIREILPLTNATMV